VSEDWPHFLQDNFFGVKNVAHGFNHRSRVKNFGDVNEFRALKIPMK